MSKIKKANKRADAGVLEVLGARVHNLKNIDVQIPRNKLVVITGLSGSGKSSLAFDTIYAEGQRRYMETLSAYARQFIGNMERPDVDKINGLSPVISIEQKSVNRNPRSTVGTITEVYDYLRLLFARASEAYSYNTGEKMVQYTQEQITDLNTEHFRGEGISILASLVKGRKGHYRELFEQVRQQGFLKVRVDGELREIAFGMQLDRYKVHDIEVVIDRLLVDDRNSGRIKKAVETAMKQGKGVLMVLEDATNDLRHYSRKLMCPSTGLSYDEPEPNTFSFNSPYGACPECNGLGTVSEVDMKKVMPDPGLSIRKGGVKPLGDFKNNWIFQQLEAIGAKYGFTLNTPLKDIPEEAIQSIMNGTNETIQVKKDYLGITASYSLSFEGVINYIKQFTTSSSSQSSKKWAESFMNTHVCPSCNGTRLKKEALYFKIGDKNISDLALMDLTHLREWLDGIEKEMSERQKKIARELLK
ncbi:MAG: excinuclease ABC subunit UvrA, partial [Bacteroidetes bacterium]